MGQQVPPSVGPPVINPPGGSSSPCDVIEKELLQLTVQLKQDKEILSQRQTLEKFPDIEELAAAVSEIEIDLEAKWRKASMLFEGIC